MTKDPDQIEAEGRRAAMIQRVTLAEASQWPPLVGQDVR